MRASISRAALAAVLAVFTLVTPTRAAADELVSLRVSSGPHPPQGAPDAMLHIPTRFRSDQPYDVVIFLHGFSSCVRAIVQTEPAACVEGGPEGSAYALAQSHERAHGNTLLLVPQQAYLKRESSAPRFANPGGFRRFLKEIDRALADKGIATKPSQARRALLVAHSAGYRAAAEIADDAERRMPLGAIVLLDALYADFERFVRAYQRERHMRLISLYGHSTTKGNGVLARMLRKKLSARVWDGTLPRERYFARIVHTAHRDIASKHFGEVLDALAETE